MTEWWRQRQRIVQTNLRLVDADMDPRQVARDAKKLGATAILFNVGGIFAWYPTKLPLQAVNPYLRDDLLGRMIEACNSEGIHFIGRFDLSKGTQKAYDAHPDWFCKTKDGRPFLYNGTYQASITGGWYHEQAPALLTEVLTRYDIQAVFFNMFGYQRFNYSHEDFGFSHDESAVRAFAEFSGGKAIPDERDIHNPVYRDFLRFQDETSEALGRKIYDHVKSINPSIGVANLAGYRDWIRFEANRSIVRPQPEWPYQVGERARFAQSVGRGDRPYTVGITHFFDFPWRYAAESESFQANRMGQALANGAEPHYYFMGPIAAQHDHKPIKAVQEAYAFHIRNQDLYSELRSAAKIGLYRSQATDRFGHLYVPADVHGQSAAAYRGAYRALLESALAFDIVADQLAREPDFVEVLRTFDVVLLPDVSCMSEREAEAIDSYVAGGGSVVATSETGLRTEFGDPRQVPVLKCLPIGELKEIRRDMRGSYFHVGKDELDFPLTNIIMLDGTYVVAAPAPDAQTLLRLQPPQKFGPPELAFAEMPPSSDPGVIIGSYGRGRVAYVPWAPDRLFHLASLVEHKQLIAQLVGRFTRPLAKLERGSRLELTVRRHKRTGEIVVHLVNYSGQSNNDFQEPVVQHGLRLGVAGVGGDEARALVSEQAVRLGPADAEGYRWVEVPPVAHMEALVFQPATS